MIDERKQKILDHIEFEIKNYGGTLSETIAKKYIDLCNPIDNNTKNIGYLDLNLIQLGDVYLHSSKISWIKDMHPNANIFVFSKEFHFDVIPLYERIKGIHKVLNIKSLEHAEQSIKDNGIDTLIYNRGEVFHNEIKYGCVESLPTHEDIQIGFHKWCYNVNGIDITKGETRQRYVNGKPNLLCHIRNSLNCIERNWPLDSWHKFLEGLDEYFNIMLVGHPNIDHIGDKIYNFFGAKYDVVPLRLSLDLFRILSNTRYLVAPDSGPLHIGASFKHMGCIDLINENSYWGFMPSYNEHYSVIAKSMKDLDPVIPKNILLNCVNGNIHKNQPHRIRSKYWNK